MGDKLRYLFAFGSSWASLFIIQVIPAYFEDTFSVSHEYISFISVFIVSLQVGQSVGVQNFIRNRPHQSLNKILLLFAIVTALLTMVPLGWNVAFVLTSAFGGSLGLVASIDTIELLRPGKRTDYQLIFATRNILLCVGLTICLILRCYDVYIYLLISIVVWLCVKRAFFYKHSFNSEGRTILNLKSSTFLSLLFGIGSALLYRNDMNLLRVELSIHDNFIAYHYILLIYNIFTALAGMFVTQVIYVSLNSDGIDSIWIKMDITRYWKFIATFVFLCFVLTNYYLTGIIKDTTLLFLSIVLAVGNPFISSIIHYYNKSWYVYCVGSFCFLLMVLCLKGNPIEIFFLYNLLIGLFLNVFLVKFLNVKKNPTKPLSAVENA